MKTFDEIKNDYVELTQNFNVLTKVIRNDDFEGVLIEDSDPGTIKIKGFGVSLSLHALVDYSSDSNYVLALSRESHIPGHEYEAVARFELTDRCVASIEKDGQPLSFDFQKADGMRLRGDNTGYDFLSLLLELALSNRVSKSS